MERLLAICRSTSSSDLLGHRNAPLYQSVTQTMPLIMRAAIDGIELGETTDYLRLIALALVLVAAASAVFEH